MSGADSSGAKCQTSVEVIPYRLPHVDSKALFIIEKLQQANFHAYIVGGGVRDQLVGLPPKDFDVATDATPEQVKALFSDHCRLIGRRFHLAHVFFKRKIIEVATFRKDPEEDEAKQSLAYGPARRDNTYGSLEEDAERRDFTINALYYDPTTETILDHCNAMEDIKARRVQLIGEPLIRLKEDPVRILRAIRFANKLGFSLCQDLQQAINKARSDLSYIPPARLFDEYIKLLLQGNGSQNFVSLREHQIYQYLFPLTDQALQDAATQQLVAAGIQNTDARIAQGKSINPAFLIAVKLWHPFCHRQQHCIAEGFSPFEAFNEAFGQIFTEQSQCIAMPRRFVKVIREVWQLQRQLEQRRPSKIERLLEHPRFRAAYDFLLLRAQINEVNEQLCQWWTQIQATDDISKAAMIKSITKTKHKNKRK